MKKAKQVYDSIKIPNQELSSMVSYTLNQRKKKVYWKPFVSVAFTACIFVIAVFPNVSYVMAKEIYEIPVIGELAKVFTFRNYQKEDEYTVMDVRVPEIKNTGNRLLETRVNEEILLRISNIIEEVEKKAVNYKKAYLETGGKEIEFHPILLNIDYAVKYMSSERVSFVITSTESFSSSYTRQFFYNLDLRTGKEITLPELLGQNYKSVINESITKQIIKRSADTNMMYFDGSNGVLGFQGIQDNQSFYINQEGKVVIVFEKYAIAPGYMGIQEFIIE